MTSHTDAHKPITSPFTFSADVRPILHDRCGRCHAPGGVAPMSLLTHVDTIPWGESMRMELMSGHMPPWRVDRRATRFRDAGGLTAKELNVLLTWLTGGTPPGDPSDGDETVSAPRWTLGSPDVVLRLPRVTLGADEQERTAEFVLPIEASDRMIRAVDLLPGTPAIVRSATIEVQAATGKGATRDERMLSLWVPGDTAVPLVQAGLAFPRDATLVVRVRYRKTWEYERREMTDESQIGVYFAGPAPPCSESRCQPATPVTWRQSSQAIAIYPDAALSDVGVVVTATRPDGRRDELIAFHPRRGWARRYWFRRTGEPAARHAPERAHHSGLPALLPPGYLAPPASRDASSSRVFVNVAM